MKLSKFSLFIFIFCLGLANTKAQETDVKKGSIADQFDFMVKKSNNFNDKGQTYEVVNINMIVALKAHTLDSLKVLQRKLDNSQNRIVPLQEEIDTLKTNLSESQKSLALIKEEKDDMVLLGMQMSKANYNMVMWSIITILFVGLLFFIFRFKNSNAITQSTRTAFIDLEHEFEEHRSAALLREQKAMRQLQDELNKHK